MARCHYYVNTDIIHKQNTVYGDWLLEQLNY